MKAISLQPDQQAELFVERKKILLSPDPELLRLVRDSLLKTSRICPLIAHSTDEILFLCQAWQPDLLILGPENISLLAQRLKSHPQLRGLPVMVMLPPNAAEIRDQVLEAGCEDYFEFPCEERQILERVENLCGMRFRTVPRYNIQVPAMVRFKGKEIPCQLINVSQAMAFLQCKEETAPATGKNVRLNFETPEGDYIRCWGRVEQLVVRKFFNEKNEQIGILIRFLDLPQSAAERFDRQARQQLKFNPNTQSCDRNSKIALQDTSHYEMLLKELLQGQDSNLTHCLALPHHVVEAFAGGLNEMEQISCRGENGHPLVRHMTALRLKLMNDLHVLRSRGTPEDLDAVLKAAQEGEEIVGATIEEMLAKDRNAEGILYWCKVKCELIRTRLELELLMRLDSPFAQCLAATEGLNEHGDFLTRALFTAGLSFITFFILLLFLSR